MLTLAVASTFAAAASAGDWTRYGYDAARSNSAPASGLTAATAAHLRRQRVKIDGTVDSSPIYVSNVRVNGKRRDLFVITTTYGKTLALDAATGQVVWRYVPAGIASLLGTAQITTASPVVDPARGVVYTASPDGKLHRLALASGAEAKTGFWPVTITHDPAKEKIAGALNLSGNVLYAVTGGYYGDAPPYQGHVIAVDAATGKIGAVWNSLCSNRYYLMVPRTCPWSGSAIWARAGVVVEPGGNVLVATGNGAFGGSLNWGDSVLELNSTATKLVGSYTPANEKHLAERDLDLGSTAPALLPGGLALQGGKDGVLRVIDLDHLPGPSLGGELQSLPTPGGAALFTTPAVSGSTVLVADGSGTAAYALAGRRLHLVWQNGNAGTSPVVVGKLALVYDPGGGGLRIYTASTGRLVKALPAGQGHWNSPIVGDGRIALPEGNANDYAVTGVLDIYR
jgi:outer membrane protein assembly factor BamB